MSPFLPKLDASSPVPLYVQLTEQVKHAIAIGVLKPGAQLPGIRQLAQTLAINPNTVAKAYRDLEHDRVLELRQGSGAFVAALPAQTLSEGAMRRAQMLVGSTVRQLKGAGLGAAEIRRLFETELNGGTNR
ncbi:MAG TPA: GntR family transcriptional regulator [Bryobacteraceae bacterium]|nr:GntR family transcriptional regulator [Bryobacteraceae bacterium]